MRYNDFKTNFINGVFIPYMNGNYGQARIELAKVYREGITHPRATLMQMTCTQQECLEIYKQQGKEFKKAKNNQAVIELAKRYISFLKEAFENGHPTVNNAIKEFRESLNTMPTSPKNLKFSKFIIKKQYYPFLGKFKCLVRFL